MFVFRSYILHRYHHQRWMSNPQKECVQLLMRIGAVPPLTGGPFPANHCSEVIFRKTVELYFLASQPLVITPLFCVGLGLLVMLA